VIQAPNNSADKKYVQELRFNGKVQDKNYVNHYDLMQGGTLQFTMGATPNKTRGTKPSAYPYSFSIENKKAAMTP